MNLCVLTWVGWKRTFLPELRFENVTSKWSLSPDRCFVDPCRPCIIHWRFVLIPEDFVQSVVQK